MPSIPPEGEPAPADGSLPPEALAGTAGRPFSLYVHVPFCATRCGYCDFNTYTAAELGSAPGSSRDAYLAAVRSELALAERVLGRRPVVSTVFFGLLALVAVLNGIVVAGRQARHELGVVRSLGFTGAQVMTALVVAAVTISVTSLLVGVQVGLLLGAATWVRVAEAVHVLPSVSVPVAAVIATVPAMAAVSVLGALWSARWVSTRRPADVLRVE